MSIDLAHFTPGTTPAGRLIIGRALAVSVVARGRMANISTIVGGRLHEWL